MAMTLPPELAERYTMRETTSEDQDSVHALVVADRTHFTGTCRVSAVMVGHWMAPGWPNRSVVVERDGRVEQWWWVYEEPGTDAFEGMVTLRPGVADADALTAVAFDHIAAWARSRFGHADQGVLRTGRFMQDASGLERIQRAGFTRTHTFWHMGGPVPSVPPPEPHRPPDGLQLDGGADQRVVHDVMQKGFAEHYAFSPQTFEAAIPMYRDRPGYDPAGWFVARLDDRPVAAMVLSWEAAGRDALLVLELATLAPVRGRGIGTALLRKAFEVAREAGLGRLELFVDSQNTTGAPALYRGVGLDVMQAIVQFERPLFLSNSAT